MRTQTKEESNNSGVNGKQSKSKTENMGISSGRAGSSVRMAGHTIRLEMGGELLSPIVAYHMWGVPRRDGSNVVWVCHALTGNADVTSWWKGLFGQGTYFDPARWCFICANVIGSCYGSEGPLEEESGAGERWYGRFPRITIRDMVQAHRLLAAHLGIGRIGCIIGGSLGGQQALEWAAVEPQRFGSAVFIATNAVHSPWGIAFNEAQRMAIEADATWGEPSPAAGINGLKAARAMAMLSYRHYNTYANSQPRHEGFSDQAACTYQRYQGEKLAARFNAYSYHLLSCAMDSHDVGRGRGGVQAALTRIYCPSLVISVGGDQLFPPSEQVYLAENLPQSTYALVESAYGHDGFLVETQALTNAIDSFFRNKSIYQKRIYTPQIP